jgi:hypothetical protein
VPEDAYEPIVRPHYGSLMGAYLRAPMTIGGIPCAAGEIALYNNRYDDRCAEAATDEEACRRSELREFAKWKAAEGITREGYELEWCNLATDATIDGVAYSAGVRVAFRRNGGVDRARMDEAQSM